MSLLIDQSHWWLCNIPYALNKEKHLNLLNRLIREVTPELWPLLNCLDTKSKLTRRSKKKTAKMTKKHAGIRPNIIDQLIAPAFVDQDREYLDTWTNWAKLKQFHQLCRQTQWKRQTPSPESNHQNISVNKSKAKAMLHFPNNQKKTAN